MEWTSLSVAAGEVTLWSESLGSSAGRPLLLIMGAMNQGLFWPEEFCGRLAEAGFLVVRYDHRDTGLSSTVDFETHPYTLSELTDDALAVLDAYRMESAAVVGLSMGGYVAQLLAVHHPQRVNGLVLLSTTADHRSYMAATTGGDASQYSLPSPAQSFISYVESAGRQLPTNADEATELKLEGWRVTHGGSTAFPDREMRSLVLEAASRSADASAPLHHALAVLASPPRTEMLHRIMTPTLVLHGVADPCLPLRHGESLAAGIPNARLVTLDMGHMFPPTMSTTVADAVIRFLGSCK